MSRPLHFLHLTTFYPPYSFGGDAMYVYRLSRALAEAGHHVEVIHDLDSYYLLHPGRPPVQFEGHPNVTVHSLRSGYGSLSPFLTQQTGRPYLKARRIRQELDGKPFDVLHFHNMSLLGPEVLTFRPARSQPVKLYTTHEHWLVCATHVLWKLNRGPCDRPECVRCTIMARRPLQIWRYTGLLAGSCRAVDQFVAPSRFTAQMHADRGFPRPMAYLPCFVERSDQDWQSPAPRPQEKPYFLFVGRLENIKGLQTLIEVWPQVKDLDLLVVGTGTYEPTLRSLAASDPRIKFLGALAPRELGSLYTHALACIVPSITYETFGQIVVESFARKTPVIVRDLGGLPELVDVSGGGYVYRSDAQLLTAVQNLADSPSLRFELGEKGYRAFTKWWSKEAHLEMYFDLLRNTAIRKFGCVPWET